MVSALNKTPNHLSAIFDAGVSMDDINLEKVIQQAAELAAWSVAAGISTISIYDKRGHLKNHAHILQVFASLRCKSFVPGQPHRVAVYLNGRRLLQEENPNPNGEQPGLSLYLLSEDDGQSAIGSITAALTERVKHGDITIDDISVDLVAEQLHLLVMPAPDLIVAFGPELNLSGYPPWHLQQAEMETLYNDDEFGFLAFANALQSYAGTEMRHGK
ncbi:hypothetical protein MY11210_001747 [Beauveria gryllotalpidicola]